MIEKKSTAKEETPRGLAAELDITPAYNHPLDLDEKEVDSIDIVGGNGLLRLALFACF